MLLWTGKLKGGWECTPKEIPCKEGMDFQILNSSALIEPRLHTIAGCWWMAKEPLQSNSSWCFLKLFFGLWALTAPPTPPYVTHSRDTYTMRGEEQGQVHDPGGSGIPDSVCSSRPQIAPFPHSQSEHRGISPCQGIREEIIAICLAQLIDTRPLFLRGISEGAKPKKVKRNDQRTWMTWMSQKTRRAETTVTLGSPQGGNLPASPVTTPSLKTEFIIIMEFGLICHPAPRGTSRVTQVLPLLV